MAEIRLIEDREMLAKAFAWGADAPRWFVESQEAETLENFLNLDKYLYFGFFDGEPSAVVRLTPCAGKFFSIDLFARRGAGVEIIISGGETLKNYLYEKDLAKGFFGWIPKANRAVRGIYRALGFELSGVECYRLKHHNRPARWLLMTHGR